MSNIARKICLNTNTEELEEYAKRKLEQAAAANAIAAILEEEYLNILLAAEHYHPWAALQLEVYRTTQKKLCKELEANDE